MQLHMVKLMALVGIIGVPVAAGAGGLFTENGPELAFEFDGTEPVDWHRARPAQIDVEAIS